MRPVRGIWWLVWQILLELYEYYCERWRECLQPTSLEDPPEALNRVAVWMACHAFLAIVACWVIMSRL